MASSRGGVAHDFNNRLTIIIGNLDLLNEVDDPKVRAELLEEAKSAALRGSTVVRQLLTCASQTSSTPQAFVASDLLRSVEAMCRTLIPESIALLISVPNDRMSVVIDEAFFATALLNIIKNGVDATENKGKISLFANTRSFSKPVKCVAGQFLHAGILVDFSVAYTGLGIPPDVLDRVADSVKALRNQSAS